MKGETMGSLYEINKSIEELTEKMVDPETGEINEEVMGQLEQLDMDLDEKLKNYGLVMKQLMVEASAHMDESREQKKRAEVKLNKYARMEQLVKMVLNGKPKEYTEVRFSFRPSKTVEIVNEDLVPDEYCIFKTDRKPQKMEIKKLLNAGKEVPGCVLVEHENLQVN